MFAAFLPTLCIFLAGETIHRFPADNLALCEVLAMAVAQVLFSSLQ